MAYWAIHVKDILPIYMVALHIGIFLSYLQETTSEYESEN